MRTAARLCVAVAAGLALADASIVTLGLPSVLIELDTTVEGVALVLGVYAVVLAVALLPMAALARRIGAPRLTAAGLVVFCAASLACGASNSLELLLVMRAAQAIGGAAALVGGFDLLDGGGAGPGRRMWVAASVFGIAVGPALGGVLTELFDWRAIFIAQAPLALPGMLAAFFVREAQLDATPREAGPASPLPLRPAVALALLSAALTAVIFLVVLLLVAGWSIEPLAAALTVSVLPVSAAIGYRVGGGAESRAAAGSLLVAAGVSCLALLPSASPWWTVAPQVLAGVGMGMALPALAGGLIAERTRDDASRLLSLRHIGIAMALAALAPIVSASLDSTIASAREQGTAALLDARLPPEEKIALAPQLFAGIDTDDPRGQLEDSIAEARLDLRGEEAEEIEALGDRLDGVVTASVGSAFRIAFIVNSGLALAAALVLLLGASAARRAAAIGAVIGAAVVGLATAAGYGVAYAASDREEVAIADPCTDRELPETGGIGGTLQDISLGALDSAACEFGSSREELLLAIVGPSELRDDFEEKYGEDPRSPLDLGPAILGL